jgi:ADP-ribose pyrophosphatase YjhB (NUDIX family)
MRPTNVESNLYQYHLLQLQREGYVEKLENGYSLTGRGLAYADRHSTTLKKTRSQPKLITVLFLATDDNKILVVPKKRQPFMGTHNLPSGKIHLDETIAEAAAREFTEKVTQGVSLISLEHFGVSHITIKQDDFVISDYIALLMRGSISVTGSLAEDSLLCTLKEAEQLKLMPSVRELLSAYQDSSVFSEHTIVT